MAKNGVPESKDYGFGTLVTGDLLSSNEVTQAKEEVSLMVRAILATGGEVLLNNINNSKASNLLSNTSYVFSSNVLNIRENIEKYLLVFKQFLEKSKFPEKYIEDAYKKMGYELFFSWLENLLVTCGFKIPKEFIKIPDSLKNEISNILRFDDELASLLIFMKSCGFIEISENVGNKFEEESELKILEVNKNDLCNRLEALGAVKTFQGTVEDSYYEFPDGRFDKYKKDHGESISFRLREKMNALEETEPGDVSMYYTIKRKRQRNPERGFFRLCNEKELKILNYSKVLQLLERFGLKKDRTKYKDRVSYFIKDKDDDNIGVKFDIDDYGVVEIDGEKVKVPTIVEIETNSRALAEYYMKKLGLEGNVKLATGSRSLFRYYKNNQGEKKLKKSKDKKTKK